MKNALVPWLEREEVPPERSPYYDRVTAHLSSHSILHACRKLCTIDGHTEPMQIRVGWIEVCKL